MHMAGLRGSRLSIQQAHVWNLQHDNQIYWVQCILSLNGPLHSEVLRHACEDVIQQHEILRTTFYRLPDMEVPIQVVNPKAEFALEEYDLQNKDLLAQQACVEATLTAIREKAHDLSRGPVVHVALLRCAEASTLLLLSLPALCADTSTLELFTAELAQAYTARCQKRPIVIDDEMLQYADVSAWQNEIREDEDARLRQTFWTQKDLSRLVSLPLPFTRPFATDPQTPASFMPQRLSTEHFNSESLSILKQLDVSPEAFFLACWHILLWRLTGEEGIPVGVACDGRNYDELTHAPGPYAQVVPLIADFAEDTPFEQVLTHVQSALDLAKEAQIYFSWDILTISQTGQPAGHFFPLSFEFENWPVAWVAEDVQFVLRESFSYAERFVLKFAVRQIADTMQWELHYDAAYMQPAQAQRTARALLTLLQFALTHLQTPVSHLPIVEHAEQERLLAAFRGSDYPYPAQTLQQVFEEQASKSTERVAVICGDQQITYGQLFERANRLAHWLKRHGVGSDVLVCLYFERSIDGLVGLLAVLKAGGAYVPLDTDTPPTRLMFQLEDTQAPVLLTQEHLLPRLPAFTGKIFCLDRDAGLLSHEAVTNPPSTTHADNLAYVIYTSGSTGTPKGVLIRQQSVVNYTRDMCQRIALESGLHFATVSTLAADLGNTSIFSSLASGGCLHILAYETLASGETFASYREQHPIDVLKIVPSHLQALLASCGEREILPRRYLVLGGESLSHSLLRTLEQQGSDCSILNHYGPTETTIGALVNEIGPLKARNTSHLADDGAPAVPIGKPIANVQVCIVDRYQQIVPVGVTGELLISGAGLAAGYLHQTELTQARFLPHPLLEDSRVLVYKTGDLARYTTDGMIEFVGRSDRQVKLRGYRIELGEIEATLCRHPHVFEAVAVVNEDGAIDRRIVAYVVSDQQISLVPEELRSFLLKTLPEYMVPTLIMQLPTLPLTANGKLNYQALPIPEQVASKTQTSYVAPRSPIEDILVAIWQDVLHYPRIGIFDNFFMLGGHSLLVTQIVARIKATFQINLPLASLFEAPTVAGLAEWVESALHDEQPLLAPPLKALSRDQDLPLSFSQQRLWFFYQLDPASATYNVPFALQIRGKLSVEALEYSLGEVIRRHEILRTTFSVKNGQPLQHIHPWHEHRLERKEFPLLTSQQRENEIQRLRREEAQYHFDLTRGPLLRTLLLCPGNDEYVLLLTIHHIISDGWSNSILLRELHTFYLAYMQQEPAPLADLPVQYADYALWQRQYLQGEVLDTQLRYWTQQLAGVAPLDLPTDYPRPGVQSFRGAELHYQLSSHLVEGLKRLSQNEGTTLFMTLLATFQIMLARYSGQDDIAIGTPAANRHHAGIEDLIGPFINMLVLRTNLSGNPTFHEVLQRVRKVSLEAYAHQDLPFEKLVEALQPERDLSRTPLFQVLFGLQNMPEPDIDLGGLALNPYPSENTTSKFDLSLTTMENGQGLLCFMEYSTDLFKRETIERMMEGWQSLLQALIDESQRHIADLPVMGPAEQAALQTYSHGPRLAIPQPESVHQSFEEQVRRTPEAIALSCGEHQLSYQELNRRANRLAHHLQACGVGPETLVALLAERDMHFLIAILAIFKAGGAYLPLDPLHPVSRLRQVLANSSCEVLLTGRKCITTAELLVAQDRSELPAQLACIEDLLEQTQSQEDLSVALIPHQLAYVIYTSGSTGIPKGAMVEHEGMLNHLYAKITDLHLTSQESVAQTASQCFDISIWQFLAALLVGGRVAIFPDSITHDPAQLLLEIERDSISIYEVVPSVLKFLLDALQERERGEHYLSNLRYLLVTGETLPAVLCQRWLTLLPGTPMMNAYGPTECSDDVTHHLISQPPATLATATSIGRPLANLQVYILDQGLCPVPARVYGEIYIGGVSVGRGYLGDPRRTAEVFLPDPWSTQEGARLYKTGDRARYFSDGTIEFLGRIDQQMKIRGFRIELGEIEAQLQQYPGIQERVVLARKDSFEDNHLVAYVVASTALNHTDLHTFLKERLPNYMVPTAFVQLDRLPLTPNGKVDLQALSALQTNWERPGDSYLLPRSPVEKVLATMWEQVLGREQVGIADNFFELGGHSLLATRVIARVHELFQVELPLRTLFEAPTIAELSPYIEAFQQSSASQMLPLLKPAERPEQIPLSFAQQRLWFLDQLEPGTSTYNIPAALRLSGPLSIEAFASSIQQLVQRHESLRTTFASRQGTPFQVIAPFSHSRMPVLDLQTLPLTVQEKQVQLLAQQEAHHPFDLSSGPLLRVHLLRLKEEEHVLLLNMHHIISDGWSIDVLGADLSRLYQVAVRGEAAPLPALPIQYADYALWQREWLQGDRFQDQSDYWLRHLAGVPATLNFPTDRPRPATQTYAGARQTIVLPPTLHRELERLSQREGVTLFMTLLASFQILLLRYSGQADIVVGTSVANRQRKELEGLIGFFVNTLALRIDLSGDPDFRQVLARVREVALQAYAHQDLPFEQLVAQLPLKRHLSYHPLFQVAFEFRNLSLSTLELPGVSWKPLTFAQTTARYDLELTLTEEQQGLRCVLIYNTDLFDASTIQHFLGHFQTMVEEIVSAPDRRVSALSLLSPVEKERLLKHWNQTQRDLPLPLHYSPLFAQRVTRTPERIAVCDEQGHLTYAALWQRVQRLAHVLWQMQVGPETLVGIYLERSSAFLVSVLAVWQCGGAYVPLDPTYPTERLQSILDQAQVPLLITSTALQKTLPQSRATLLYLEQLPPQESTMDEQGLSSLLHPQQLAYVIYTSGSTGVPKGVMVTHEGMLNHLWAKVDILDLGENDIIAQTASQCFDISVWQLLAGLLQAGQVQVLPDLVSHDPFSLLRAVRESAVSVLQVVPSLLRALLDEPYASEYLQTGLRWMIVTGEAMPIDLCQRWWREYGTIKLLNAYGPTECSDDVTHARLEEQEEEKLNWRVPIGTPIANTQIYVLDTHFQPVPIGVPGELSIGGVSLARGYLHRPEITAALFIPDPFSAQPGARLYQTGDLVRYLSNGTVEYLGRLDQQVKLRGYRIELEEIQAVIHQHPDVQQAVVTVREDTPDDKRLVAYYIGREGVAPSLAELREHVSKQLPEYMVPSAFLSLTALPLTPNGKLDLEALPVPDLNNAAVNAFELPRTPIEEALAAIMAEMLGVRQVSVFDNFFELGGHSLLATRVIARAREMFQVELPLRLLFETPTIVALSQHIEALQKSNASQLLPALQPIAHSEQIPLSFAQQRLWFMDQLEPDSATYNISVATQIEGQLDFKALDESLREMIRRHASLRTRFVVKENQPVQEIMEAGMWHLPLIDLSAGENQQWRAYARQLAQQEAQSPFNLALGPLWRGYVLRLGSQEHVLLLTVHHIISDGWSMDVLVREMGHLYNAYLAGRPSPLPDLPIQYTDYAIWQRRWLQGEVLERQLAYWTTALEDLAPLDFPTDHPRPPVQTHHGAQLGRLLPATLRDELRVLSQQEGVTLFMTLLAAFQVLLSRYSGQQDIAVGTPIANRTHAGSEGLIGFFVNTLVLRCDLSGHPGFQELLGRVREVCLGAYAHQDVPFEKIVEVLQPERALSRSPLFQVMLNLQETIPPSQAPALHNLRLSPLPEENLTAKYDLTLSLLNTEQGLQSVLEYNTDLFEAETIMRLLDHWHTLLQGIVAHPELPISSLPLLSEMEQQQQLRDWNGSIRPLPAGLAVHRAIEAQVERTPDAVAVCCNEQTLTYNALNQHANALAASLLAEKLEPEALVAVLAERSLPFLIALLAIWKAGGAYLPLDILSPASRLRQVIVQSGCSLVLTTSSFLPVLTQESQEAQVLALDSLLGPLPQTPLPNSSLPCLPKQLAYVIFTSGSTGTPKGVMVEQEGMFNHLLAKIADVGLSALDRVAQNGPQNFDIFLWQSVAALLLGGHVEIIPDEIAFQPARLLQQVEERAISQLQIVPALLRGVLQEINKAREAGEKIPALGALRWLIPTGDALSTELCVRWFEQYPSIPVLNTYGSTECSDDQCHYPIATRAHLLAAQEVPIVPIGTPIANMQAYILDKTLRLLPVGVVGELYIGGTGVGRGYLADPARTAQTFLPDLYASEAGARLYKTGDLVRRLPNGQLEFVGRSDSRVKVRGYRIEPGEIEAALALYPGVQECLVLARRGKTDSTSTLVGYVVGKEGQPLHLDDLKKSLRERLPDYMIPTAWVFLEALPLNANGKVDRKALPEPGQETGEHARPEIQPDHPIEELLLLIWQDVLERREIGRKDNFFALGGHSLLATQVISRIRAWLQVELPLRSIFEAPTIADLTAQVEMILRQRSLLEASPMVTASRQSHLPLSFAQQRLWFLDQLEPGNAAYNIPVAVRLQGELQIMLLLRSLALVACRHESLRTTFQLFQDSPIQVIAATTGVPLALVDLSGLAPHYLEAEARALAEQEADLSFDLVRGPLWRSLLLRHDAQQHTLLLTMHHIISDEWSMGILVNELTSLYNALEQGAVIDLPKLPIQYADYALWQRQWLQGEVLQQQLDYWKQQLAGVVPLALPTDYPRPPIQTFQGSIQHLRLPAELSQQVRALSQQEGATLFMTLLAAFNVLLHYYTGQEDLIVGTNVANRNRAETEGLIGFFVNQLVLRTKLSGNPNFRELVQKVKETALGAYVHQDLPFDRLFMELNPERDLSRPLLLQVKFDLQHAPVQEATLSNIRAESVEPQQKTTKHDLFFNMLERDGDIFGRIEYRTDLFRIETIIRLIRLFEAILEKMVLSPSMRLHEIQSILMEIDEREKIHQEKDHKRKNAQQLGQAKRRSSK